MYIDIERQIKQVISTKSISEKELIQTLWSGYGEISRYHLKGAQVASVVVKHVSLPTQNNHPRGWNTTLSHQRKLTSYQVEVAWYRYWAKQCDETCYVPACLALEVFGDEIVMVLEDLDALGFDARKSQVTLAEMKTCLSWLANFHATYLSCQPEGLWSVGTYWHLNTRPDELDVLTDLPLKAAAIDIDKLLNSSPYKTFVHGDAKLANFCFSSDGTKVAAVDFQYVGGGCGMKDVAYFIGSCLYEEECEKYEAELLDSYFSALKTAVEKREVKVEFELLEQNWRELFSVAWTDFHRFIKGWSPGHWKINSYSERLARDVVDKIDSAYVFNK